MRENGFSLSIDCNRSLAAGVTVLWSALGGAVRGVDGRWWGYDTGRDYRWGGCDIIMFPTPQKWDRIECNLIERDHGHSFGILFSLRELVSHPISNLPFCWALLLYCISMSSVVCWLVVFYWNYNNLFVLAIRQVGLDWIRYQEYEL